MIFNCFVFACSKKRIAVNEMELYYLVFISSQLVPLSFMLGKSAEQQENKLYPRVEILIATYQGEKYLPALLDSLLKQTYTNLHFIIRDDGSTDGTVALIEKFKKSYPHLVTLIQDNKNLGVIQNFAKLMQHCSANYALFADQDDYWLPEKVELSIKSLQKLEKKYGKETPLLVHTDLKVVDCHLNNIHPSFWKFTKLNPRFITLNRLLVQNCVTGCTMAFNKALIERSLPLPANILMHDWWMALVASSFGKIASIPTSTILYRQHGSNTLGAMKPLTFWPLLKKIMRKIVSKDSSLFSSASFSSQKQATVFYEKFDSYFTPTQKKVVESFCKLQEYPFFYQRFIVLRYRFFTHLKWRNFFRFFFPMRY